MPEWCQNNVDREFFLHEYKSKYNQKTANNTTIDMRGKYYVADLFDKIIIWCKMSMSEHANN